MWMEDDQFIIIIIEGVWPRLQSSLEKPHWISLDFDQWEYQREEGEESDGEAPKIELSPEIMKKIVRRREGRREERGGKEGGGGGE